jgi:tetratricopeptide (TPR) repeat protein
LPTSDTLYCKKDQFEEALKMLDKALTLNPKCGEAHYSYAQYYANKENWKKAEESANKAIDCGIKLDPEFRKLIEKNGVKLKTEPTAPPIIPSHYTAAFLVPAAAS